MKVILARHDELREMASGFAPTHQGEQLASEITDLKMATIRRRDELSNALQQQEAYQEQVTDLTNMIASAQTTLSEAAPTAASVEGLRHQLAEHNVGGTSSHSVGGSTNKAVVFDWRMIRIITYRCVVAFAVWVVLTFLIYSLLLAFIETDPYAENISFCKKYRNTE